LNRFGEPAWNYQVIRFLDAHGKDIIPRRARVWTTGDFALRMTEALKKAGRLLPRYLEAAGIEYGTPDQGVAALGTHCFWTGKFQLGNIDGVISTEAGWFDGREVTLVRYDRNHLPLDVLSRKAARVKYADKVYAPDDEAYQVKDLPAGKLDDNYCKSKISDQKKQLQRWKGIQSVPGLTCMQLTRVNALAPVNMEKPLEWLSPRQRRALTMAVKGHGNKRDSETK
jgi:hypothetical protein